MSAARLVELLKRHLKAHGITYAKVAERLGLSEASVKRMFSRHDITLQRLEDVCRVVDLDFVALARALSDEQASATHLTVEQEQEIISNPKLFLVALCAVGNWTLEQIIALYDISRVECIGYLAHLDKLRIIDLMPENRIRPLIGRTLTWLPDGPFQRYFRSRVEAEYLGSRFDRPNELFLFLNGMLSTKSAAELIARMRKLAAEFEEMHRDDLVLAIGQRHTTSVLLTARSWEPKIFRALRRTQPAEAPPEPGTSARKESEK